MPQIELENILLRPAAWEQWNYRVVARCDECGGNIYEGDNYYSFSGDAVCENCVREYVRENFRRTG